jgi:hypothetical protein
MKSTMISLLASVVIGCITIPSASAQYIFDVTPELNRYLWYHQVINAFDHAIVSYDVGEFRLNTASGSSLILTRVSQTDFATGGEGPARSGSDQTGIDHALSAQATTRAFTVPSVGGSVSFVRVLQASSCEDIASNPNGGTGEQGTYTPRDQQYLAGRGRILDTSEFVIQVVDATNGTVYGTIDSVGLLPNPTTDVAQRYGTSPDQALRVACPLPTEASGNTVILRVSIRRYGSSPRGMVLRRVHNGISLSAQHAVMPPDGSSELPSWCDSRHGELLDSLYHLAVTQSYAAHRDSTGCLLLLPHGANTRDERQEVQFGLMQSIRASSADLPTCTNALRNAWNWYMSTLDHDQPANAKAGATNVHRIPSALSLTVHTEGTGIRACTITSDIATTGTYEIVSMSGQQVGSGSLRIASGASRYDLNAPALASGAYLVRIRRDDNLSVQQGVIVSR